MNGNVKRLYKSRTDRMIDGVCGGIAKYLDLDPTLVRIAWVLLTLLGGSGIVLYIVAMIVMPKEPFVFPMGADTSEVKNSPAGTPPGSAPSKKNSLFWGLLLVVVGSFLFLENIGLNFWHHWRWFFDGEVILSVLLILAGVAFLYGGRNSLTASAQTGTDPGEEGVRRDATAPQHVRRLARSFADSKLFGVCGGLGEYFNIDSTIVRILFVIGALASGGAVVVVYIIMAIVFPRTAFKAI